MLFSRLTSHGPHSSDVAWPTASAVQPAMKSFASAQDAGSTEGRCHTNKELNVSQYGSVLRGVRCPQRRALQRPRRQLHSQCVSASYQHPHMRPHEADEVRQTFSTCQLASTCKVTEESAARAYMCTPLYISCGLPVHVSDRRWSLRANVCALLQALSANAKATSSEGWTASSGDASETRTRARG